MGAVVSEIECNFQRRVEAAERSDALEEGRCRHCGISEAELASDARSLTVCADEFLICAGGEQVAFDVFPLCPRCHEDHHSDVQGHHNPCQIKARRSLERL